MLTLDFRLLSSRTVIIYFCVYAIPDCAILLQQPWDTFPHIMTFLRLMYIHVYTSHANFFELTKRRCTFKILRYNLSLKLAKNVNIPS
jgi:hypothetical protein